MRRSSVSRMFGVLLFVMRTFLRPRFVVCILVAKRVVYMPTRTLKLRLRQLLENDENRKNLGHEGIAEEINIAPNTVRKYLRNEPLRLDVRILEKFCDWLEVDIGQILELVPCDFFPHGENLLRLRSKPDSDFQALVVLEELFSQVPIEVEPVEDKADRELSGREREDLVRQVYQRDCIIVGSPHQNSAGEIALCTLFGADPNDRSEENRRKLPLLIEMPPAWHPSSALIESTAPKGSVPSHYNVMLPESGEKSPDRTFHKKIVWATADYYPQNEFKKSGLREAQDFGIILVADHWIDPQKDKEAVRTYWFSGFSAVGTEAALRVVQDDVRGFSLDTPRDRPGEFVLAIVTAKFNKEKGALNRTLNDYDIVDRIRGSLPNPVRAPSDNESHGVNEGPQRRPPSSAPPRLKGASIVPK